MRPAFFCVAFLAAASFLAQQDTSIDEPLIFPSSNELIRAAQLGYDRGKDWRMELVYRPPWRALFYLPCGRVTWEVRAAGPLLLAVMEGRTARIQSQKLPASEEIAHSRGTLFFEIVFFARTQEERATAVLAIGSREFDPLETYVSKAESVPCGSGFYGTQAYAEQVRETFTFGFAESQKQPDWTGTTTLKVRRGNILEPLALNLRPVLAEQAKEIRRNFH
jgi:hypothetical protein